MTSYVTNLIKFHSNTGKKTALEAMKTNMDNSGFKTNADTVKTGFDALAGLISTWKT